MDAKPEPYVEKVLKDATRLNCLKLALIIEQLIASKELDQVSLSLPFLSTRLNSPHMCTF